MGIPIIAWDNDLSPVRHQAIMWTNTGKTHSGLGRIFTPKRFPDRGHKGLHADW